jgi:hypothetical protein
MKKQLSSLFLGQSIIYDPYLSSVIVPSSAQRLSSPHSSSNTSCWTSCSVSEFFSAALQALTCPRVQTPIYSALLNSFRTKLFRKGNAEQRRKWRRKTLGGEEKKKIKECPINKLRSIMVLGLQQVQKNGFHGLYHFFLCV